MTTDRRFLVIGRMQIRKHEWSLHLLVTTDFFDTLSFETRQQANERLTALSQLAAQINTPPFPKNRDALLTALHLSTAIRELTCLRVAEGDLAFHEKGENE